MNLVQKSYYLTDHRDNFHRSSTRHTWSVGRSNCKTITERLAYCILWNIVVAVVVLFVWLNRSLYYRISKRGLETKQDRRKFSTHRRIFGPSRVKITPSARQPFEFSIRPETRQRPSPVCMLLTIHTCPPPHEHHLQSLMNICQETSSLTFALTSQSLIVVTFLL